MWVGADEVWTCCFVPKFPQSSWERLSNTPSEKEQKGCIDMQQLSGTRKKDLENTIKHMMKLPARYCHMYTQTSHNIKSICPILCRSVSCQNSSKLSGYGQGTSKGQITEDWAWKRHLWRRNLRRLCQDTRSCLTLQAVTLQSEEETTDLEANQCGTCAPSYSFSRFYLILQSPQPVVKVSAFCQMFKHAIHSIKTDILIITIEQKKRKEKKKTEKVLLPKCLHRWVCSLDRHPLEPLWITAFLNLVLCSQEVLLLNSFPCH